MKSKSLLLSFFMSLAVMLMGSQDLRAVNVSTFDDMKSALADGSVTEIVLQSNITWSAVSGEFAGTDYPDCSNRTLVLDLNGKIITVTSARNCLFYSNGSGTNLTIKNGAINGCSVPLCNIYSGTLNVENLTFSGTSYFVGTGDDAVINLSGNNTISVNGDGYAAFSGMV